MLAVNDNVARYRKEGSNIYLFRWGSMNQRISFPDAIGVIITTGNPEDLILKKMTLRALDLVGGEIGAGTSPITKHKVTVVTFDKYQSLMVGDLQIVNDWCVPLLHLVVGVCVCLVGGGGSVGQAELLRSRHQVPN